MDILTSIIAAISAHTGLPQPSVLAAIGLIIAISNLIGKSIGDNETGWLGGVRSVTKAIGLVKVNNTGAPAK